MSNNFSHIRHSFSSRRCLNVLLLVAAYAYLTYKLVEYDRYDALWADISEATVGQWIALVVSLILVGANMWMEAYRWRYLCAPHIPMSMREAQQQVYYGRLAGLWTPWKVGEIPGRLMLLSDRAKWPTALAAGALSGWLMTAVIVLVGVALLPMCGLYQTSYRVTVILSALALVLSLLFLPVISRWLQPHLERHPRCHQVASALAEMSYCRLSRATLQTFVRYACWALQMVLCMLCVGISPTLLVLCSVPLYYLLVTITPSVGLVEGGVRASLAVLVWQVLLPEQTAQAVLAAVLVWALNTLIPLLIGTIVALRHKELHC